MGEGRKYYEVVLMVALSQFFKDFLINQSISFGVSLSRANEKKLTSEIIEREPCTIRDRIA